VRWFYRTSSAAIATASAVSEDSAARRSTASRRAETRDQLIRQVLQGGNMPLRQESEPAEVNALVAFMERLRP